MAQNIAHGVNSSTLADVLERVLDKGIVVAGDIRIRIADIELIAIQIRLVVCSVDKAKEMGMDWWVNSPIYQKAETPALSETQAIPASSLDRFESSLARLEERLNRLDVAAAQGAAGLPAPVAKP